MREVLRETMNSSRLVRISALDGYATVLHDLGHLVEMESMNRLEMKQVRLREAKIIFKRCKKDGFVSKEDIRAMHKSLYDIYDVKR